MKKILGIACLCAVVATATAKPAYRGPITRVAEDGTEQIVYLHGNEYFHYMTNAQGEWLDESTVKPMSEEMKQVRKAVGEARLNAANAKQAERFRKQMVTGLDPLLSPRGAVILVSYKDLAFESSHEDMVEWAMGENYTYNGATGSIHQYFHDQSWGAYDLEIDVYGPVKVSKNYSYYGKDSGGEGNDAHPDELVKEACILAHDSLGADFSNYDFDGDGKVDWVVIIYAGYGQASGAPANTIWPHQYELSYTNMDFDLDGKTVDHYCVLNEKEYTTKKRDGIGTFCHEFSHVIGLPDFYITDYNSSHRTLADWDVMDYGPYNNNGNTPPNYSAYERWFMGWITPTLVNDSATVTMPALTECRTAVLLTDSGVNVPNVLNPNPKKFYLLENRQQEGWDKYLAGSGMMITKVSWNKNKWEQNTVNNTKSSMGVDMIEAKSNTTDYSKATDLYPAGATKFTSVTKFPVTDIAMQNGVVVFDVAGGGEEIILEYKGSEGIEDIQSETGNTAVKRIENGRVVILRDGKKYDILGNRL